MQILIYGYRVDAVSFAVGVLKFLCGLGNLIGTSRGGLWSLVRFLYNSR